jgi:hypothetical protein
VAFVKQSGQAQAAGNPRVYAGIYLRTKKQTHFWGWGTPNRESPPPAEVEQSRPALADWLRMAHSLLDSKKAETPTQSNTLPNTAQHEEANQPYGPSERLAETRRVRFVCSKRVVGLVIR